LIIVAITVVTLFAVQVQSIAALSISAQPRGNVTIADFDIFEVGVTLNQGQKIVYSYDASLFMLFQLHRHIGNEIITYYITEGKSHTDTFTAPESGDYYFLWDNDEELPSKLTYQVSLPESTHHIDYNGSVFDVKILSNSKLENMTLNATEKKLSFNIQTPYLTPGFVNLTLPEGLLNADFNVEGSTKYFVKHTSSSSLIVINTDVGTHNIIIHTNNAIPEFEYSYLAFLTAMAITILLGWRFLNKFKVCSAPKLVTTLLYQFS